MRVTLTNRQVLLRRRPTGLVVPEDTELVSLPAPEPAEGEALEPMRDAMRECSMRQDMGGRPFEILSDLPGESFGYRSDETYGDDSPVLTRVFAPAGERIVVLTLVHAADEEPPVDLPTLMPLAVERATNAQD